MIKIPTNEISRKVIHILSSVMPLSYLWFIEDKSLMVYILVGMSLLALVIEYLRNSWTLFSRLFNALFYYMLREHELKGKLTGATWLLIGWSITVMLFNIPIAVAALLFLSIGDSFAALGGKLFPKVIIGNKTLSGTLCGLLISFTFVLMINQSLLPIVILIGAIAAMGVELIPLRINDNLTIPIFSGSVMMVADRLL